MLTWEDVSETDYNFTMNISNATFQSWKMHCIFYTAASCLSCGEEADPSSGNKSNWDDQKMKPNQIIEVKPEHLVNLEEMRKGQAVLSGKSFIPIDEANSAKYFYSGNTCLVALLKDVRLNTTKPIVVDNLSLDLVAEKINEIIPQGKKWEIKVADSAKGLKITGVIDTNLIITLGVFMHDNQNFHCIITDGVIELREGELPPIDRGKKPPATSANSDK